MKPTIIVENVSKKFSRRTDIHRHYGIKALLYELMGRSQDTHLRQDEFLAVDDVSFTLYPGDTFALIGRNGCGKTTTLKMLNGTLKPDAGKIIINGRVQALIALGAGFNPRLSGRENIYNAGAVLGLSSKETRTILDEVIDFAELDEFIDSPVQTYSSGMTARLGFSVAVHLKPEILLIDEILAVGDFAFQNKCFAKMEQLKKNDVTIILVSHSHRSVIQLCEKALWLHKGKTNSRGSSKETVEEYLAYLDEEEAKALQRRSQAEINDKKNDTGKISSSLFGAIYDDINKVDNLTVSLTVDGKPVQILDTHDTVVIEYSFDLKIAVDNLNVTLVIFREDGLRMTAISTLEGDLINHIHQGHVQCRIKLPNFNLSPGGYVLVMPIFEGHSFLYRNVVKRFIVKGDTHHGWGLVKFKYEYEVIMSG